MLTDADLQKIKRVLAPEFKKIDKRFVSLEEKMKEYTQDAANTVLTGVERMFKDHASGKSYPHTTEPLAN